MTCTVAATGLFVPLLFTWMKYAELCYIHRAEVELESRANSGYLVVYVPASLDTVKLPLNILLK